METLEEKVKRVLQDNIALAPYDPRWPTMFEEEKKRLFSCLPNYLLGRIEHCGSTAVPNLIAKPIIDLLVEVTSLEQTKLQIVPMLAAQGCDYFWRPTHGDDVPPFYAWFIKRDSNGRRTHHLHMVERHFEHWDWLLFRDYLIAHPVVAGEYAKLKLRLAAVHAQDRVSYHQGKFDFIQRITALAKQRL
jgi:GrpB-like predicted nucleotidyltransferase (UPF0157 family)